MTLFKKLLKRPLENLSFEGGRGVYNRLGELVPAGYEKEGFIVTTLPDGSATGIGFVLEILPQTGADAQMASGLLEIISPETPKGSGIAFTLFASPDISAYTESFVYSRAPAYARDPAQSKALFAFAEKRAEFFEGLAHAEEPIFRVRDFRAWVSVVLPVEADPEAWDIQKAKAFEEKCFQALKAAGFFPRRWSVREVFSMLRTLLNPHKAFFEPLEEALPEDGSTLAGQAVLRDTRVSVGENGLTFSSPFWERPLFVSSLSFSGYPEKAAQPMMGSACGADRLAIPCPFLLTMGLSFPDFERTKAKANVMAARAEQIAASEIARFVPSLSRRAADYKALSDEYERSGGLVRLFHTLTLFSSEETAASDLAKARAVLKSARFEPVSDTYLHLQSFLASLPLGLDPAAQKDLLLARRFTKKTMSSAAAMAPVLAESKGAGPRSGERSVTPLTLLTGRRGQIAAFDLFAGSGNFNATIVGTSGAGKSALAQELALGNLATGGRTYIFDIGYSYAKMARQFGGQFISFDDAAEPARINIFEGIADIRDDMGFILPIIAQMASPNEGLTDYEMSALQTALIELCESGEPPGIDGLINLLRRKSAGADTRLSDIADELMPWGSSGTYGKYFSGRTSVSLASDLVVLELEGLKNRRDLQSVILLCLIFAITKDLTKGDRSVAKMVIIDEAWDLLTHKHAGKFIEEGYRRARKQNASFVTVTQSYEDYFQNATANAAFTNADIRITLRQKEESISYLERSGKISLSPWEMREIKTLSMRENEFAECLISMPGAPSAVFQIRFDPFSRILYSSKAADTARIDSLMAGGATLEEAVAEAAKGTL